MLVLADEVISPPAVSYPAAPNADAVGAGDACSAGILVGWSLGLSPARTVELANHLGAFVASQPGATPLLPRRSFRWSSEHDLHHPIAAEVGLFRLVVIARQTGA